MIDEPKHKKEGESKHFSIDTWAAGAAAGLGWDACYSHRYRKSLNRLLKVCSFFATAIISTNEANKAAGMCY
jgi:hypothetical protein